MVFDFDELDSANLFPCGHSLADHVFGLTKDFWIKVKVVQRRAQKALALRIQRERSMVKRVKKLCSSRIPLQSWFIQNIVALLQSVCRLRHGCSPVRIRTLTRGPLAPVGAGPLQSSMREHTRPRLFTQAGESTAWSAKGKVDRREGGRNR